MGHLFSPIPLLSSFSLLFSSSSIPSSSSPSELRIGCLYKRRAKPFARAASATVCFPIEDVGWLLILPVVDSWLEVKIYTKDIVTYFSNIRVFLLVNTPLGVHILKWLVLSDHIKCIKLWIIRLACNHVIFVFFQQTFRFELIWSPRKCEYAEKWMKRNKTY